MTFMLIPPVYSCLVHFSRAIVSDVGHSTASFLQGQLVYLVCLLYVLPRYDYTQLVPLPYYSMNSVGVGYNHQEQSLPSPTNSRCPKLSYLVGWFSLSIHTTNNR